MAKEKSLMVRLSWLLGVREELDWPLPKHSLMRVHLLA